MMVTSPKTKKQGKRKRPVPIFDELRPYLAECFELAEPVSEFVMNRYRSLSGAYIWKRLEVQIERAGLKPWPRIFHNLRASRQTDLTDSHPEHVACAWTATPKESRDVIMRWSPTITSRRRLRPAKRSRRSQSILSRMLSDESTQVSNIAGISSS